MSTSPEVQDQFDADRDRLLALEAIIEPGLATFVQVGQALTEIRDDWLWLRSDGCRSFEDYAQRRFGLGKAHALRMIAAASAVEAVSPIGDGLIRNEAQAREVVAILKADDKRTAVEVLRRVRRARTPVTAASIRATWLRMSGKAPTPRPSMRGVPWRSVAQTPTSYEAARLIELVDDGDIAREWVVDFATQLLDALGAEGTAPPPRPGRRKTTDR
jgi:hypothetical protein